jgi:hypothetical protein
VKNKKKPKSNSPMIQQPAIPAMAIQNTTILKFGCWSVSNGSGSNRFDSSQSRLPDPMGFMNVP